MALAEFNALRSEILGHMTTQAALIGLGFTALGVVIGLVVSEGGDNHLLLAVPPLAAVVVLLHAAGTYRAAVIGDYIREELWPYLEEQVGTLPSWEVEVAKRRRNRWVLVRAPVTDFAAMALFIGASIAALLVVDDADSGLQLAGWALTFFAIAYPAMLGLLIRAKAKPEGAPSATAKRTP